MKTKTVLAQTKYVASIHPVGEFNLPGDIYHVVSETERDLHVLAIGQIACGYAVLVVIYQANPWPKKKVNKQFELLVELAQYSWILSEH